MNNTPLKKGPSVALPSNKNAQTARQNNSTGADKLNLTLKRQVKLKRYPMLAKVTFLRQRPDLVALLNAMVSSSSNMPSRLKAYLFKENLWDDANNSITLDGQQIIKTGLFNAAERNLYHIWFTDNDPLLGTRPVLIQRESHLDAPKYHVWKKGHEAAISEFTQQRSIQLMVVEEEYRDSRKTELQNKNLTLTSIQPEVICSPDKSAQLEMQWAVNTHHSTIHLVGQLDILQFNGKNQSSQPEPLDLTWTEPEQCLSSLLGCIATALDGEWDESTKRLSTTLENVKDFASAVQNFRIGNFNCKDLKTDFGHFTSVQAAHIPVQPKDQDDAENWQRYWLEHFYKTSYRSVSDAQKQQGKWLDNPALDSFTLPLKQPQSLLAEINREQQPEAYWHIAAMADLSPNSSNKLRMPFSLIDGDTVDINKLVGKLTDNNAIEHIIYSDRYVHTARQYRNLSTLAGTFSDATGMLLTLKPQYGKQAQLPDHWERNYFDKSSDNHGRYWIFIGPKTFWCWECTSGLDFMKQENGVIEVDGFPTFTPKTREELPDYLQQQINALNDVEAY